MRRAGWGLVGLIIAACGGHIEGENAVKPCPTDMSSSCSDNARCTLPTQPCYGSTTTITCDCSNGQWACPDIAIDCTMPSPPNPPPPPPKPPPTCPDFAPNDLCTQSMEGMVCVSWATPCMDYPSCRCTNGRWLCPVEKCADAGSADAKSD